MTAGILTFSIWSVYATSHWAMGRPQGSKRGVLRWVFIALVLCGFGWALLQALRTGSSQPALNPGRPEPIPESAPAQPLPAQGVAFPSVRFSRSTLKTILAQ